MFEEKLDKLYSEIVNKINSIIPCEWRSIHFEGQICDTGGRVYFFFNTKEKQDEYIYSLDIPEKFNVSEKIFYKLYDELFELTRDLYNIFIENEQESWVSVIIHYDNNGEFKLKYNYIDWFEKGYSQVDIISYFKYKYLNINPSSDTYLNKMKKMERFELKQTNGN